MILLLRNINYCFIKNLGPFRTAWPISIIWCWRPRNTTGNRHGPRLSWRQKKCLRVYHLWKPATQESPEYFSWTAENNDAVSQVYGEIVYDTYRYSDYSHTPVTGVFIRVLGCTEQNTTEQNKAEHNTIEHNRTQQNTTQKNTTQHNTRVIHLHFPLVLNRVQGFQRAWICHNQQDFP